MMLGRVIRDNEALLSPFSGTCHCNFLLLVATGLIFAKCFGGPPLISSLDFGRAVPSLADWGETSASGARHMTVVLSHVANGVAVQYI